MECEMGLDVIVEEFSAGYGVADLVGGVVNKPGQNKRASLGIEEPLDDWKLWEVHQAVNAYRFKTVAELAQKVPLSESTLRNSVIPRMLAAGLLERGKDYRVRLGVSPPPPVKRIVAVEAKQHRWQDAVRQAYRYTSFADLTYVAVWDGTSARVDRTVLKRLGLGLIAVEPSGAKILLRAEAVAPRRPKMHRYCSEALYREAKEGRARNSGLDSTQPTPTT